jgi:heterodisulfide reductase subunit C2
LINLKYRELAVTDPHTHKSRTLADDLFTETGLNAAKCYQCGKCSAGCPMAEEMPLSPHQIIRMVQLDRRKRLMEDESIWLCLTCEMCTSRCPNQFDPARFIDALREIALKENAETPRKIRAFHKSFLDQIRMHGRLFEFGLIAEYKLRSGALFDDVAAAPGMISKGKLAFAPHRIDGTDEIRRIFDACLNNHEEK